jgi:hypothetical protein
MQSNEEIKKTFATNLVLFAEIRETATSDSIDQPMKATISLRTGDEATEKN